MTDHIVSFDTEQEPVEVKTGTLLSEAAQLAGIDLNQPCGGQGRCGRCALQITKGSVRRRSTIRLSEEDLEQGYALACQSVIEGDIHVSVPEQEKIERLLTSDRTVAEITVPKGYDFNLDQAIQAFPLTLTPPDMSDQTDDWSRLNTALRKQAGMEGVQVSLSLLQRIGNILRERDWEVTAILDLGSLENQELPPRLIELLPGKELIPPPLWAAAIDIGTTTITVWLVDLITGKVEAQTAQYNKQISRGEDVVSRIVFAGKDGGLEKLRSLVMETINELLETACKRIKSDPALLPSQILKATIVGNSTMIHLALGIPPENIRMMPFTTTVNQVPALTASEMGLNIHPEGTVDCLPGVASYVGADITAGVLSAGVDDTEQVTLFMDVGTNGEIVLGSREWLVTCACSAGPAFEGAGVASGMRATKGAIEDIWINDGNLEPTFRVIGNVKPHGICGSGLIALLAEMFLTGVIDKAGNFTDSSKTSRIREGKHGWEYVICFGEETSDGDDIVITHVDVDNLLRAKAAIYAGFSVLAVSVGIPLDWIEQVLIGGSFGKYINVEKAIEIGLLPDLPWDKFQFLGNTAVRGAYLALLDRQARQKIKEIASRMTYIELSADNTFYDAFMSALFLPHTDLSRFPSVETSITNKDIT
ncbi:MAG TPA: ASKHA domain-containing protein [Anaerolineales bacterium]|nr:ASKHA domain-containing protein [Anaerolineales bacterium]